MTWPMALMLVAYLILCFWLIFVILIQESKGGGLSSLGAASEGLSEALGATGAEKTFNKITTFSAVGFLVLAIALAVGGKVEKSEAPFLGDGAQAAPATQLDTSGAAVAPAGQGAATIPGGAATAPAGASVPVNPPPVGAAAETGSADSAEGVAAPTAAVPAATAPAAVVPAATVPATETAPNPAP